MIIYCLTSSEPYHDCRKRHNTQYQDADNLTDEALEQLALIQYGEHSNRGLKGTQKRRVYRGEKFVWLEVIHYKIGDRKIAH